MKACTFAHIQPVKINHTHTHTYTCSHTQHIHTVGGLKRKAGEGRESEVGQAGGRRVFKIVKQWQGECRYITKLMVTDRVVLVLACACACVYVCVCAHSI